VNTAIVFERVSKQFTLHRQRARSFQELALSLLRRDDAVLGMAEDGLHENFWALRDVSFTVGRGEAVGLIGPNGAGKSTTLKLISRIIAPTSGRIEVNGRLGALLELGAGFHPDLTGRENVYLNGSILGLNRSQIQRKLGEIIAFAELERFIDVPVKHYSSGMYVRLGFSVAIHTDPEILLIDEVLAVGDAAFQHKCLERIKHLQNQGTAIAMVSHSMDQVARMCDSAFYLQDGCVRSAGPPKQVIADYLTASAAEEQAQRTAKLLAQKPEIEAVGVQRYERGAPRPDARRWGDGCILIQSVRLLGPDGRVASVFYPDQPMCIEFDYAVQRSTDGFPSFGVAIYRSDGLWCYGTNTALDAIHFPQTVLPATGTVVVELPTLRLLQGDYTLDVAIQNANRDITHDYARGSLYFTVHNSRGDEGVFRPCLRWSLRPGEGET
jgi:lipopolysaccharide transport system ATP-binding protein